MRTQCAHRTLNWQRILDPRFPSSLTSDDAALRSVLQSTYPVPAGVTEEVTNETSNVLFHVIDYGTEADSVDEVSKFLQATAIRDRN